VASCCRLLPTDADHSSVRRGWVSTVLAQDQTARAGTMTEPIADTGET
jgi:hypothetical protein